MENKSATIMIVDDDTAISSLIGHQLRSLGYRTVCLHDGLEALQRFATVQPDLVLLDVMMPHLSGWNVCRQIRACSHVPIILLTAKDADSDTMTGLRAGADDYVVKPYRIVQLQARIESALRKSAQRSRSRASTGSISEVSSTPSAATIATLPQTSSSVVPASQQPRSRLGATLREERRRQGVSLYQAEQVCRVRWDYLQAIEKEQWDYVPHAHRQAAVRAYAAYLGVPLRYPHPSRTSLVSVIAPALAVVVMLVVVVIYLF
ncbi:MAG: response regulator [Roseiflexus sp.]